MADRLLDGALVATFPRGISREERVLASKMVRAMRPGMDAVDVPVFRSKLPGDPLALRGIPAIGRGVGGAIPGTNPELRALRETA